MRSAPGKTNAVGVRPALADRPAAGQPPERQATISVIARSSA
jgi:hypothetical protein